MNSTAGGHSCPFCKRPLDLTGAKSGKIGCSRCRNIFYYDAKTGALTPLAPGHTKIRQPSRFAERLPHGRAILISAIISLSALVLILWLTQPWERSPDVSKDEFPEAVLDEISRHLKSLAE